MFIPTTAGQKVAFALGGAASAGPLVHAMRTVDIAVAVGGGMIAGGAYRAPRAIGMAFSAGTGAFAGYLASYAGYNLLVDPDGSFNPLHPVENAGARHGRDTYTE